jgi:hypothetical protein
MRRTTSAVAWSGDMLDRPEMVAAFAGQLRQVLSDQAAYVARIRRDAEAMWKENPPDGYSSFEAWWRHSRVTSPFAEIQEHLEAAAKLTFRLEARYRRHRHEIPQTRQAAAQAKAAAALPSGTAEPAGPPAARQPESAPPLDGNFMEMIRRNQRSA